MPASDQPKPPTPAGRAKTASRLVVCPECRYGFPDPRAGTDEYTCPWCGYHWEALTLTEQAVHGAQRRRPQPELHVVAGAVPIQYELPEGVTLLGRDRTCPLHLDNLTVSRRHARVTRQGEVAWVEDLGSSGGTFLNGQSLQKRTTLTAGDQLVIGGITLRYAVRFEAAGSGTDLVDNSELIAQASGSAPAIHGQATDTIPLKMGRLTFGRGPDRDVVLSDALISRRHAVLEYQDGGYYLSDTQSRIGTFVNGKAIIRARLEPGDRVQLGPYLFRFEGTHLARVRQPTSLAVRAVGIRQTAGDVVLLDQISLVFQPSEFVGLLGPSGAGKTTLLDALNGLRPAVAGQVYINDEPLYEQYDRLRHLIGYVPQDDIIHGELTCRQALYYAGRLRLPADVTDAELARLIDETLAALDLTQQADVPIGRLSGGQRKRASVGVELLSKPGILFLDEPTSGLDPGTESRLMRKFRQLADQGRTIICTTHVMENVDLFDQVVVLAPGGKLAYFGPPVEAKRYFGIDKFTLLYDRLEEKQADAWQQQYREAGPYRQLLVSVAATTTPETLSVSRQRLAPAPASSFLGQWALLTRRYSSILRSDRQALTLLLLQPLLITGLVCLVCNDLPLILFLLVIAALWFGCSNAAQQLVKERAVYRRERMVNLRVDAYVLSKFLPLAAISGGQCALMLGLVWLCEDHAGSLLLQAAGLLLASWNGVALGLVISALAANADKAMAVVPLSLLPQIILAGVLVPLPDMNGPTRVVSYAVAARWANQVMEVGLLEGRTVDVPLLADAAYQRALWNLHPEHDLRTSEGRRRFLEDHAGRPVSRSDLLGLDYGILALFVVVQSGLVVVILRRQDAL
ncbi:MAG: FHA domain-containing protein [Gemmataceae bacterium]|nr:FHA domain-containing protein [Gemmataceae bacterium]